MDGAGTEGLDGRVLAIGRGERPQNGGREEMRVVVGGVCRSRGKHLLGGVCYCAAVTGCVAVTRRGPAATCVSVATSAGCRQGLRAMLHSAPVTCRGGALNHFADHMSLCACAGSSGD